MSSSPTDAASSVNVASMSISELRLHVERCERLLQNPNLLKRLKDGGEGIQTRYTLFTEELTRREQSTVTDEAATTTVTSAKQRNEAAASDAAQVELYGEVAAQRLISEKYKDYRVPVEAIARRMYEGSLSEREIQRILADVPPSYFLTGAETQAMLQKGARDARTRELSALRQQVAAGSGPAPPQAPAAATPGKDVLA